MTWDEGDEKAFRALVEDECLHVVMRLVWEGSKAHVVCDSCGTTTRRER